METGIGNSGTAMLGESVGMWLVGLRLFVGSGERGFLGRLWRLDLSFFLFCLDSCFHILTFTMLIYIYMHFSSSTERLPVYTMVHVCRICRICRIYANY